MCEATVNLVGFGGDEEVDAIMLVAEFPIETFLEATECRFLVAGDRNCRGLVAGGMDLDLVLERIVVEIICTAGLFVSEGAVCN
jgi:hypothetical protein